MPQSPKNVALYQKINDMVENFLDKDFDKACTDQSKTVFNLKDDSGVEITIDISKIKQQ